MKNDYLSGLLMILAITATCACGGAYVGPPATNGTEAIPVEERPFVLGTFERLSGTPILIAEIHEVGGRGSLSSGYESGGTAHNFVFLDSRSLESHRLFDTNQYVILSRMAYPTPARMVRSEPQPADQAAVEWLVYQVVKEDTNGDTRLGSDDRITIGISDASGGGYTEVLNAIDDVLGVEMIESGRLVVIHRADGEKQTSILDLAARKVLASRPLVDLGPDVR